jgi:NAD(P)H-nitrite reductase large subunit
MMNQQASCKRKRHLIIGNSAAALSAIRASCENDPAGCITVVCSENYYAYSPVLLTYYVSQKINRSELFLAGQKFYQKNGVELILGNPAIKVDPQNQQVTLAGSNILEYDNRNTISFGGGLQRESPLQKRSRNSEYPLSLNIENLFSSQAL